MNTIRINHRLRYLRNRITTGLLLALLSSSSLLPAASPQLSEFETPPDQYRPRFYWFWMGGSMTKEGIRADLEAMKEVGVGGVLMMNVYPTAPLDITCMGDKWWDLLTYANTEAQRNNILFGTHNCPGWSTSGGPWNTVENSMQKVVFTETEHLGPGKLTAPLLQAEVDERWNYYRDIVVYAIQDAKSGTVPREHVIDVSKYMNDDGTLTWEAPAGEWTLYRFGHTTTGHMNGPPIKGGQGLESDKMSREATKIHFDSYAKKIIDRMQPLVGETFNNFELDSYEAGQQNWTPKYREEFMQRRGYDPLPWFPALAGVTVGDADQTARFNRDMAKTISDLFVENHYQYLAELCNENGVTMDYEAYGGPFDPLAAGGAADMPMGECWTGKMGWSTVTLAVSAAHTHGRPVIGCEALTSTPMHSQWKQTPYSVKAFADKAFAMGINMMVLHCYAQQPWDHVAPGMSMNFWGTHFSRTNTWWDYSKPWFDYLARCQFMLQQGMPVVDICVLGTNVPGGMPAGYKVDLCNDETLSRMTVKDGYLVLPASPAKLGERSGDGMRYRLLVLPADRQMPLATLQEVERLVKAGAAVSGPKPNRVPGLTNFPQNDQKLQVLADRIWGDCEGASTTTAAFGQGRVFWGKPLAQVLPELGVPAAVRFTEAGAAARGMEFNHRSDQGVEIYFISNQEDCHREVTASFRATGLRPFFCDPDTGTTAPVSVFEERDGRTLVPLRLAPSEACFVVFGGTAGTSDHLTSVTRAHDGPRMTAADPLPLRIAQAKAMSKDRKTFVDLTEAVQALVQNGQLKVTPEAFRKLTAEMDSPLHVSVDYLVEDDRRTAYAHPHGTLQVPQARSLSPDVDYEVDTDKAGKTMLSVWQPGSYTCQWASGKSKTGEVPTVEAPLQLNRDWQVSFEPNLGAPDSIELQDLHSLSRHELPGVQYYSGTATYEKRFHVKAESLKSSHRMRLDLGQVKSLAEVTLNGQNLGVLWKPPFHIDITGHLRAGSNHLQIKVANTWANRMIGDEQEPEDCQWSHIISWPHGHQPTPVGRSLRGIPQWVIDQTPRPSSGRVTFCNWKYFSKDTPLLDSGLIGPVRILSGRRFELNPAL